MAPQKHYDVIIDGQSVYHGPIRTAREIYDALLIFRNIALSHPSNDPEFMPHISLSLDYSG